MRLLHARRLSCETGFILDIGEGLSAQGRIDLLAESDDGLDIVDFKTDRCRRKEEHDLQLALYRRAATAFRPGSSLRGWIFWLRDARAERMDADFKDEDIRAWALSAAETVPRNAIRTSCWA
jgi:predicted component of type VI protein secretion system